jgi:hypothetical protein
MEVLVFGLIALNSVKNQKEQFVPEPTEFQSFDLRALEQLNNARDNSASRVFGRKQLYVAQRAS